MHAQDALTEHHKKCQEIGKNSLEPIGIFIIMQMIADAGIKNIVQGLQAIKRQIYSP